MDGNLLGLRDALVWTAAWFGVVLFYTFLNVAVWKRLFPAVSEWLNLAAAAFLRMPGITSFCIS